jgi:hypothetical protein
MNDIQKLFVRLSGKMSRPNPDQTWPEIIAQWRQHFILCGSAYLHCVPDEKNPTEVRVVSPMRTTETDKAFVVT